MNPSKKILELLNVSSALSRPRYICVMLPHYESCALASALVNLQTSGVIMTFSLRQNWRTTTALCLVSSVAVATPAYAANGGRTDWDKRTHHNHFVNQINNKGRKDNNNNRDNKDKTQTDT